MLQEAASRRVGAPYSVSSRYCTTSNCSGPTAPSSGTRAQRVGQFVGLTTPSCSSCVQAVAEPLELRGGVGCAGKRSTPARSAGFRRSTTAGVLGAACRRCANSDCPRCRRRRRRRPRPRSRARGPKSLCELDEPHASCRSRMRHRHVALELAGDDADERDAVAVLRVHVRLDLEDEAGEGRRRRAATGPLRAAARRGRRRECCRKRRRAAAARRSCSSRCRRRPASVLPAQHCVAVEVGARAFEHLRSPRGSARRHRLVQLRRARSGRRGP